MSFLWMKKNMLSKIPRCPGAENPYVKEREAVARLMPRFNCLIMYSMKTPKNSH